MFKIEYHLNCTSVHSLPYTMLGVQFSSVPQSCLTPCDPIDCSTPGFPIKKLLELAQTQVHQVSDAIQPSHPLSSPSPPAFNLAQHQGLFQWVSSLYQVAKVLVFHLQHRSFQWIFRTDSFTTDWFDLHAVQGTLKSLLPHHRSKASILFFSFIFISGRLITLQYCSGFCHTLTWISHGFTSIPHPDPPPTSLSI